MDHIEYEKLLDEVVWASPEREAQIVQYFVNQGEQTLSFMREKLKRAPKPHWPCAVKVIRSFGAPVNEVAIPELVLDQVGDRNAPGRDEAVQTLFEMNQEKVLSQLISVLIDQGRTIPYWDSIAEGICAMLQEVPSIYSLQCIPALTYILGQNLEGDFDKSFVFDVLNEIEREKIPYVLPFVIEFALNEGNTELGNIAYELIVSFPEQIIAVYGNQIKLLLDIWKDESQIRRE